MANDQTSDSSKVAPARKVGVYAKPEVTGLARHRQLLLTIIIALVLMVIMWLVYRFIFKAD